MFPVRKVVFAVVLFVLSFLSGFVPTLVLKKLSVKLDSFTTVGRTICLLNCLTGGVFFATSFLNLLPEAQEKMKVTLERLEYDSEYPFTMALVGIGFFLILSVEQLAHAFCLKEEKKTKKVTASNDFTVSNVSELTAVETDTAGVKCDAGKFTQAKYIDNKRNGIVQIYKNPIAETSCHWNEDKTSRVETEVICVTTNGQDKIVDGVDQLANGKTNQTDVDEEIHTNSVADHALHVDKACETNENLDKITGVSKIRGLLFLMALSVHMIFDGLALGLLDDSNPAIALLTAMCIHKILIFFSVGITLLDLLKTPVKVAMAIFTFSLISPLGIGMGIGIKSHDDEFVQDLVSAILQGIATGNFVYITFFEILQKEFSDHKHRGLKQTVSVMLGFVLVAVTKIFEGSM